MLVNLDIKRHMVSRHIQFLHGRWLVPINPTGLHFWLSSCVVALVFCGDLGGRAPAGLMTSTPREERRGEWQHSVVAGLSASHPCSPLQPQTKTPGISLSHLDSLSGAYKDQP